MLPRLSGWSTLTLLLVELAEDVLDGSDFFQELVVVMSLLTADSLAG